MRLPPSFETAATRPPQDEVGGQAPHERSELRHSTFSTSPFVFTSQVWMPLLW